MAIRGKQIFVNSKPTMVYIVNFFFVKKTLTRFTRLTISMWSSNLSSQQLGLLTCVTMLDNKYVLKPFFLKIRFLATPLILAVGSQRQVNLWVWAQPWIKKKFQDNQSYMEESCLILEEKKTHQTFKWIMLQILGV